MPHIKKRPMLLALISKSLLAFFAFALLFTGYTNADVPKTEDEQSIIIPKGNVQVAAYYFPNWGPLDKSEWKLLQEAKPRFKGHQQPKVPLWGYENENDPAVMAKKIDAAANNGIDVFIFDWYYFDRADGGKYLYKAMEEGFLGAKNNNRLKFALMWCNHDVGIVKGAVKPKTFEEITDYVIENYFKHPSYWKIDGCPYFSIYQFDTFIQTFDADKIKALEALDRFREKVKAAGFPNLHLNGVSWGFRGNNRDELMAQMKINSSTSYVWIHHNALPDFPTSDYSKAFDAYFRSVEYGGGHNGLKAPAQNMPVPYHINVTMGWDSSPRCRNTSDWMKSRGYPFGAVIVNNSPYQFKKALIKAKSLTMLKPENERVITINAWNEWSEGSYLEPDTTCGMEYLQAVKEVFHK